MRLGGWEGICDLTEDDDDVGTTLSKNNMAAALIHHLPLIIFLIKVTLFNGTNCTIVQPFIGELRPSPKWTVDGSILS